MSPIIGARGGLSASAYGLFAPPAGSTSSYESIATISGTGSNQVLTFSDIPQTYKHLQIVTSLTTSGLGGSSNYGGWITLNGDTASNYADHSIYADGSSNQVYTVVPRSSMGVITYSTNTSYAAATVFDILDYSSTNKYKTVRSLGGGDSNGTGLILFQSGHWRSSSAVTSISLYLNAGFGTHYFTTNASATLFGMKG